MKSKTDCAIVGSGPAGLSAALELARKGAQVIVLDEQMKPGGQLIKQIHKFFGSGQHKAGDRGYRIAEQLIEDCHKYGVVLCQGTEVLGIFDNTLIVQRAGIIEELRAEKIILCCGAKENVLSFQGADLPGVMTAGALQTMMNMYRVLPGKRAIVIGTGNVGLIVAYQFQQAGGEVLAMVEMANHVGGYKVHASKLKRTGVKFYFGSTVEKAYGHNKLESAVIQECATGRRVHLTCDLLIFAVGMTPETDLAHLAGCAFSMNDAVHGSSRGNLIYNDEMRTNQKDIFLAGDICGIEEASSAMEEGRLAGLSVALDLGLIDEKEYKTEKADIHKSLLDLRSGPHGERGRQQTTRAWRDYAQQDKLITKGN